MSIHSPRAKITWRGVNLLAAQSQICYDNRMQDRPINISITTGTVFKVVLILVFVWALFTLQAIVLDVLTAITIASAIEPAVRGLRRTGLPRVLCIIGVYLFLIAGFFSIFYFFLPLLFQDFLMFVSGLPGYIDSINRSGILDQYTAAFGVSALPSMSSETIVANLQGFMNTTFIGNTVSTASNIFNGVFSFIIIFVFSFYFAVLETGVDDFLSIIVPKSYQSYALNLWKRSQHKIGLWMQGQLLLAVIMGVLVFLGLTILGVPHAPFLAAIAAAFEIIPVFGPTLSAIPAIAIALGSGGISLGLLTVALYVIAQQFENHLIYPLVVTRVVGVPPLLVILALIIGAELAGFLGIILSVPISATIQEFVRDFKHDRIRAKVEGAV